jgi:F-type H+-transporting ATPase subunit b
MEIISNIALISINETLVVQLVSFLIFLFLINRIMFRPLQKVMAERATYMVNLKQEVAAAEADMATQTDRLKAKEAVARNEANQLKKELEKAGNETAGKAAGEIRDEITAIKLAAAKEIDTQMEQARQHLTREAETLATTIMEKILNRRLSA